MCKAWGPLIISFDLQTWAVQLSVSSFSSHMDENSEVIFLPVKLGEREGQVSPVVPFNSAPTDKFRLSNLLATTWTLLAISLDYRSYYTA